MDQHDYKQFKEGDRVKILVLANTKRWEGTYYKKLK
jgi:hypothetical protein